MWQRHADDGEKMAEQKKKIGIFSFTCCEGCQLQILDLEKRLLDMMNLVDISYFKLAKENSAIEFMDIAFVEGAISTKHEKEKLEKIRQNSKYLVSIGACACHGGIPSMRNLIKSKRGYHPISSHKTCPVDRYVRVDYHIRGCPIEKEEFESVFLMIMNGKMPQERNAPVCVECSNRGISCLMRKGIPCMGPITAGGCNAVCPEHATACEGCRGSIKDANTESLIELFKKLGLKEKEIKNKLYRFVSGTLIEEKGDNNQRNKT